MKELYVIIEFPENGKKIYRIKYEKDEEYVLKCYHLMWSLGRKGYFRVWGNMPLLDMVQKAEPGVEIIDWDKTDYED